MKNSQSFYGSPKRINRSTHSAEATVGSNITDTIDEAITLSAKKERKIKFDFNGVTVRVRSDSNPGLIHRDWLRSLLGYIGKTVGPYPNPVLTDEEKASDARIKAKNDRASEKRQDEYEAKAKIHRDTVEAKLVNAPVIELADEDGRISRTSTVTAMVAQ